MSGLPVYRLERSPLDTSRGRLVGFVIRRPAAPDSAEAWRRNGWDLARVVGFALAAAELLRFSASTVPAAMLPELHRVEVDADGGEHVWPAMPEDLEAVAKVAALPELVEDWPARLERLVAAGRLPSPKRRT